MKKIIFCLVLFLALFSLSTQTSANQNKLTINLGKMDGQTNYTISGSQDGGWKSKLVFPLESRIIRVKYSRKLDKKNNSLNLSRFKLSFTKNIDTKNNGKMKDSDWFYALRNSKAIYSETNADLKSSVFNIEFYSDPFYKIKNTTIILQSGYEYKNFDYMVHDGIQYNYIKDTSSRFEGKALEYEVKYHITYGGLKIINDLNKLLDLEVNLNFSPIVHAKDIDDHILRSKKSTGETMGQAAWIDSNLRCEINNRLSFSISGKYEKIETDGTQSQYYYDGKNEGMKINGIDHTINLEEYNFKANINYKF